MFVLLYMHRETYLAVSRCKYLKSVSYRLHLEALTSGFSLQFRPHAHHLPVSRLSSNYREHGPFSHAYRAVSCRVALAISLGTPHTAPVALYLPGKAGGPGKCGPLSPKFLWPVQYRLRLFSTCPCTGGRAAGQPLLAYLRPSCVGRFQFETPIPSFFGPFMNMLET